MYVYTLFFFVFLALAHPGKKKRMIVLTAILFITNQVHSASIKEKNVRSGKFMRFGSADDLFSDVLDEMQDPLSAVEETVSDRLRNPHRPVDVRPPEIKNSSGKGDKIALYNRQTGQFEMVTLPSAHLGLRVKPVTESGSLSYGGQNYKFVKQGTENPNKGNETGDVKIFWTSVTDAIQNLPFIPVQVNVPDMISAMANFISSSIPIINRFTNPNRPRLPEMSTINSHSYPVRYEYASNELYQTPAEDREFRDGESSAEGGGKRKKNKKNQKRKHSKRKNGKDSPKGLVPRPFLKRSTESPTGDKKIWQAFGSSEQLPTSYKNMPFTRQKFVVRDRETFNFKNSDIRNSPIMILNLPERPIVYHKTKVQQRLKNGETKVPEGVKTTERSAPRNSKPKDVPGSPKKAPPKRMDKTPKGNTTERTNSTHQ